VNHFYESVPGQFDFQDIYSQAVQEAKDGDCLVEVGCWKGRSSAYLAVDAINSGKRLDISFVDLWEKATFLRNDPDHPYEPATLGEWLVNLMPALMQARSSMGPLHMSSVEAAESCFNDRECSFVFIDGNHQLDAVAADIDAWLPKVMSGGILAGHDYVPGSYDGVVQAVNEKLTGFEVRGYSWFYRVP
jgi:cephalosporin hydroxylase